MVHRGIDVDNGRIVAETNKSQSVLLLIKLQYNSPTTSRGACVASSVHTIRDDNNGASII